MDYLQGAIEKARRQAEGEIGKTPMPGERREKAAQALVPGGGIHPPSNAGQPAAEVIPPIPQRISYSKTRVVEPSPEVLSRNRVIAWNVDDNRVEEYRQLRSQVLSAMNQKNCKTLSITSAHEGAGKSLTSVNLAISISQEVNQTVMLVDLDLRKPTIHTTLGLDVDKGIVDHLMHGEPLENVLINPGYPRLVVVPGKPQGHHASEILTSPEMKAFLLEVTARYPRRIIIFDLPPLLRNDDALVFVPKTDACLLVVEEGATRPDELKRALQLIKKEELLGTVLNKVR